MAPTTLDNLLREYAVGGLLSGNILIVDDELPNLTVLSSFLDGDYTVLEAGSGEEALALADAHPIDVVISDQRMPGMTGVELLNKLRAAGHDAPGIILTGYTDTPALIAAINEAHVFRFLRKPWQPEDVLSAVMAAGKSVSYERAARKVLDLLSARTTELQTTLGELQKAQQSLLQMDRLVTTGRLAAGITHDLRNAMSSLVMLEYEVSARLSDPELVETIAVGLAGLRNLLDALETMNQFAKAKRLAMHMEYFDPALVVRDANTVMRMDLNFRARQVAVDAPRDVLPLLLGDRQKLVQVLVNLLRNAAQATRADQRVWIWLMQTDAGRIQYVVEDDGPGISAEVRDRLFEAFASTKNEQGMGMGLYMSKMIVESHGGTMRCVDRPGGGARFEIELPPAVLEG